MITIEVSGLAELDHQLHALGEEIALKVIRESGEAAMQPVVTEMKRHAGYDAAHSGEHMRDSIRVRTRSRLNDDAWPTLMTFSVGPSSTHTIKALAQEYGTVKQASQPFMRPALDNTIPKIINTLSEHIRRAIKERG